MERNRFSMEPKPVDYTINVRGELINLGSPMVMGILNVTPDSFYAGSRVQTADAIRQRAHQIMAEGGGMIDVGACSTRPGGEVVSEAEEMRRLEMALPIIKEAEPNAILSVDTFRASVARRMIEDFGVDIINDVEEGRDKAMFETVAELGTPYILMSVAPTIETMLLGFAEKVNQLRALGQKDIILDPGFGFGKSLEENFVVLNEMEKLHVLDLPILVGISRKRMIYQTLDITATDSLNGTTVINTWALEKGAAVLRVHDVRAAVEIVKLKAKRDSVKS